jgi:putative ABC transport system permease protein
MSAAAIAAVVSGLVFGTLPAFQASRLDVATTLRRGGRGAGAMARRLRTWLVVAELAVAAVVVLGAVLFGASFLRVLRVDLGFNPRDVLAFPSMNLTLSPAQLRPPSTPTDVVEAAAAQTLTMAAIERVRSVPGVVAAAAVSNGLPLTGNLLTVAIDVDGRSFTGDAEPTVHGATSGYLAAAGVELRRGRWITDEDAAGTPPVAVLSEDAAEQYLGGADPIGRTVLMDGFARQVVGVVAGVRIGGPESGLRPQVYIPYLQTNQRSVDIVIRTAARPGSGLVPAVRAAIHDAAPQTFQNDPYPIEARFTTLIAQRRFNMVILSIFGSLAILIAAVGIYGLMAFLVTQRTREIGVRMALGARPQGILRLVLGGATRMLVVGLALGLAGAALLERTVRGFLFNAQPHDPLTYALVALILLTAGLVAAALPARRAARVDPLIALRVE